MANTAYDINLDDPYGDESYGIKHDDPYPNEAYGINLDNYNEDGSRKKNAKSRPHVRNSKLDKASIGRVDGEMKDFPFNPSNYNISSTSEYSNTGGFANFPYPQFTQANLPVVTISNILVRSAEGHDVQGFIDHLTRLQVNQSRGSHFNYPPDVLFIYGSDTRVCKLTDLNVDKTMFTPNLECAEARISITLLQVDF